MEISKIIEGPWQLESYNSILNSERNKKKNFLSFKIYF